MINIAWSYLFLKSLKGPLFGSFFYSSLIIDHLRFLFFLVSHFDNLHFPGELFNLLRFFNSLSTVLYWDFFWTRRKCCVCACILSYYLRYLFPLILIIYNNNIENFTFKWVLSLTSSFPILGFFVLIYHSLHSGRVCFQVIFSFSNDTCYKFRVHSYLEMSLLLRI